MNGQISQKTSSGLFPLSISNVAVRYFLLFIIGAFAMVVHARLRLHLGIPGHQGFLYMAMLVGSSLTLNNRFSGLVFATGSSAVLAFGVLGFANPFIFVEYLFVGIVADLLLNIFKTNNKVLFVFLIGALGYGMIPIIRLVVTSLTGFPFGSFIKHGFILTFASHILFGMAGAFTGFGISKMFAKK